MSADNDRRGNVPWPDFDYSPYVVMRDPAVKAAGIESLIARSRRVGESGCLVPNGEVNRKKRAYVSLLGWSMTTSRAIVALLYDLDPRYTEWEGGHRYAGCWLSCCALTHVEPQSREQQVYFRELHGNTARGETNGATDRTNEEARTVWIFGQAGARRGDAIPLAELIGATPGFVRSILAGRAWRGIQIPELLDLHISDQTNPCTGLTELQEVVAHRLVRLHQVSPRQVAWFFGISEAHVREVLCALDQEPVLKGDIADTLAVSRETFRKAQKRIALPPQRLFISGDRCEQAFGRDDLNQFGLKHLPLPLGRPPKTSKALTSSPERTSTA